MELSASNVFCLLLLLLMSLLTSFCVSSASAVSGSPPRHLIGQTWPLFDVTSSQIAEDSIRKTQKETVDPHSNDLTLPASARLRQLRHLLTTLRRGVNGNPLCPFTTNLSALWAPASCQLSVNSRARLIQTTSPGSTAAVLSGSGEKIDIDRQRAEVKIDRDRQSTELESRGSSSALGHQKAKRKPERLRMRTDTLESVLDTTLKTDPVVSAPLTMLETETGKSSMTKKTSSLQTAKHHRDYSGQHLQSDSDDRSARDIPETPASSSAPESDDSRYNQLKDIISEPIEEDHVLHQYSRFEPKDSATSPEFLGLLDRADTKPYVSQHGMSSSFLVMRRFKRRRRQPHGPGSGKGINGHVRLQMLRLTLSIFYHHVQPCPSDQRFYCMNGGSCLLVGAVGIKTCRQTVVYDPEDREIIFVHKTTVEREGGGD